MKKLIKIRDLEIGNVFFFPKSKNTKPKIYYLVIDRTSKAISVSTFNNKKYIIRQNRFNILVDAS